MWPFSKAPKGRWEIRLDEAVARHGSAGEAVVAMAEDIRAGRLDVSPVNGVVILALAELIDKTAAT